MYGTIKTMNDSFFLTSGFICCIMGGFLFGITQGQHNCYSDAATPSKKNDLDSSAFLYYNGAIAAFVLGVIAIIIGIVLRYDNPPPYLPTSTVATEDIGYTQ